MKKSSEIRMKKLKLFLACAFVAGITFSSTKEVFAQNSKWVAPSSANSLKNPIAGDKASLKDAKQIYQTQCAPCHGEKGKGDGVAAGSLNPKPANHSSAIVQGQSDGAIFWKMSEGKGAMQAYKTTLTDNQRWGLVNYIRTLKK